MKLIVLSHSDDYSVSGLIRYLIRMFYDDWVVEEFKKSGIEIVTSKHIKEVLNKTEVEYLKEINSNEGCLIFGIHPYGWEMAIEYCPNVKKIIWQDDLHYFANFTDRKGESVQEYSEKFDIKCIDDINFLVTPSSIYFKNLGIETDKLIDFFYFLDDKNFIENKFTDRKDGIVLSGVVFKGYNSRLEFDKLRNEESFKNLICKIEHPGYEKNKHMTEFNYYSELTKYKAAFVGHHCFPLNFLLAKHIEVLMCGCLGFFEPNPLLKDQLGLIEYVHYIPCFDENGLIKDANFYLNWINSDEGHKISIRGKEYVRSKFGKEYVKKFIDFLTNSF
jgi:hypothetical protein